MVQNSAAMIVLYPECSCSTFFKELPFLTSDEFKSFRDKIQSYLLRANDPMENSLDVVIPCMVRWHWSHQDLFLCLNARIKKMQEDFMNKIHVILKKIKVDRLKSANQISVLLWKLSERYL